jgi:putative transposase
VRRSEKEGLRPTQRRALAEWFFAAYATSVLRACRLTGFTRTAWYRRSQARDQTPLRTRIRELAPLAQGPRERWSMDFVHDQLADGRAFRVLTVVDQWSRSSPVLECGLRRRGTAVADALDRAIGSAAPPRSIAVGHGTEFISRAVADWAHRCGAPFDVIRPGKPTENGDTERFNGTLRDECLNVQQFLSLADAKQRIEAWREDDNGVRPHRSLGHLTPNEYAEIRQGKTIAEAG